MRAAQTLKRLWEESGWEGGQGGSHEATRYLEDAWEYAVLDLSGGVHVSASEKLRALEARGATGKWEVYEETHHEPTDDPKHTDRWILDDGVILNWGDGDIPLGPAELIVTLRNALPLIADVVEAAELDELHHHAEAARKRKDALTALSNALEGGEVT